MTKAQFEVLEKDLIGQTVERAQDRIHCFGYKSEVVPEECKAITMIARHKTVIIWQSKEKVRSLEIGDPCEFKQ